jgi:hypothetical protein
MRQRSEDRPAVDTQARRRRRRSVPRRAPITATPRPADLALAELEERLLAELQLAQALDLLAEWERELLWRDDPAALAGAAASRADCRARLRQARLDREAAAAAIAQWAGLPEHTALQLTLARLDAAVALRLSQYWHGILAHEEHANALVPGSRALARIAAERHAGPHAAVLRRYARGEPA